MKPYRAAKKWLLPLLALAVLLSCNLPGSSGNQQPTVDYDQTEIALGVQATSLALQQTQMALAASNPTPPPATDTPIPVEPTSPFPAPTIQPSDTPPPPATPTQDIKERIKAANVLVYEDMWGRTDQRPWVHDVINNMNFSGGRVIELADRLGDFKSAITGPTDWDLIIVATESRSVFQGEMWSYVYDQVNNNNVALVAEVWNMDQHYTDIAPLLKKCGVRYEKDWLREPGYKVEDFAIYWLQPKHEFFDTVPNPNVSLGNPNYLFWVPPLTNDAGDRIRLDTGGDAVLLAGLYPNQKSQAGVIASCMDGRMIVQTFSTHDYRQDEVMALWENYIIWVLTNHFKAMP